VTTPKFANTELVAMSWLSEVFGTPNMIGTTLPTDNSTWAASGFVLVTALSGSRDAYVPMVSPVIGIDTFAFNKSSNKSPWGKSANIAEVIMNAAIKARPHRLTLPGGYPKAQFFSAIVAREPRRIPDLASYARFSFDLNIYWAPVS
jgi:hypothetical protein